MFENDDDDDRSQLSRRLLIAGGIQAAAFAAIGARLFDLQVIDNRIYGPRADKNRISVEILSPKRGRIFDNSGIVLADNYEIFRVTILKALAVDVEQTLKRVEEIIPLSPVELNEFRKRFKRAHGSTNVLLAEGLSFEQVAKISVNTALLPGLSTDVIWQRTYPIGESIGHVVGVVGKVTTAKSDTDTVLRLSGMRIGKSGVEAGFETELRGKGGRQELEIDARGRIVRQLKTVPPVNGSDITLTINGGTQARILNRLQTAARASCVAVDIETGAVRALVSTPAFDPDTLAKGISTTSWKRLAESENQPLLNRAVAGRYQPASAFAPITALAALAAGLVSKRETIRCNGQMSLDGKTYRCRKPAGHGGVNLEQALAQTCDVYFYELARRVKLNRLLATAEKLGIGETFDIGLPEQRNGQRPAPSDGRRKQLNSTLEIGVGFGDVLVTPLQLATMTARLASGKQIKPHLTSADGNAPMSNFKSLVIEARHVQTVRDAMIAAQRQRSRAVLRNDQSHSETLQSDRERNAIFAGVTPTAAPRFAVSIVVEQSDIEKAALARLANDIMAILNQEQRTTPRSRTQSVPKTGREGE